MIRPGIRAALFAPVLLASCSPGPVPKPDRETMDAFARRMAGCFERGDMACVSAGMWEPEVEKTGLRPEVVARVFDRYLREDVVGRTAIGPPKTTIGGTSLQIERMFTANGSSLRGYNLLVLSSPDGPRLILSITLFALVANAEMRPGEKIAANRVRVIREEMGEFRALGWQGAITDSQSLAFEDWNALEKRFLRQKSP